MTVWILSLMLALVPRSPAQATFPVTAAAIDRAAHDAPLYDGEDGVERTAAQLVALGYYESRFDPEAVGEDAFGESLGLFQVHESNARRLHVTRGSLLQADVNARAALVLLRESLAQCCAKPARDRLAFYATGRGHCDVPEGLRASRARVWLAEELLREHPPFWTEAAVP